MATVGLDAAEAPSGPEGRALLDAVGGAFWGAYVGGPRLDPTARATWTPAAVQALATSGVEAFAPVYVGLQAGDMAGVDAAAAGARDGLDAAAALARFGWGSGTLVFLDVEAYDPAPGPDPLQAYASAWVAAVRGAGCRAGVYATPSTVLRYYGPEPLPDALWVADYGDDWNAPLTPSVLAGRDPARIPTLPEGACPGVPRLWQCAGDMSLQGSLVDASVADAALPGPPPAAAPATCVVEAGDTLWALAQRHGTSVAALEAANPQLKDPGLIFPGEVLNLP